MTLAQLRIGMSRRAPIDFPMPSEIRLSRMGQSAALSALTFLNLFLGLSAQVFCAFGALTVPKDPYLRAIHG